MKSQSAGPGYLSRSSVSVIIRKQEQLRLCFVRRSRTDCTFSLIELNTNFLVNLLSRKLLTFYILYILLIFTFLRGFGVLGPW